MQVAVAGAGIAGLASAVALAARGISVRVCERAGALEEIGAGLQLAPNAMAVLHRLGVTPHLEGKLIEPRALVVRDGASGALLFSMELGTAARARYGHPYCTLHRADLQAALRARAGELAITIDLRAAVAGVRLEGDRVHFTAGSAAASADVIVAADGVRSAIRTGFFGHAGAASLGRVAWRATLPLAEADGLVPLDEVGLWLAAGAHLVHYPVARGGLLNVVVIARDETPPIARFGAAARKLLDAARPLTQWPLTAVDASRSWVAGRVALAGDAAHGMAPSAAQGGAQALEDAWALAAALDRHRDRPAVGLAEYQRRRQGRAIAVARASARNLEAYETGGLTALARNIILKALPQSLAASRMDWLFAEKPA